MPTFTRDWVSHVSAYWRKLFASRSWDHAQPLTVIEIGSFEGRGTLWLLENLLGHADSRIHCLDTFEGGIEHGADNVETLRQRFDANIAESPEASKVRVLQGPSHQGLVQLAQEGVRADLVYVDGSHQAPDVLEDLVLGFRLAKVGAVIICDDYLWSMESDGQQDLVNAPKLAVDTFVNCNIRKLRLLYKQELYQLAFEKIGE